MVRTKDSRGLRAAAMAIAVSVGLVAVAVLPASGDQLTSETFMNGAVSNASWSSSGTGGSATGWPGKPCLTVGTSTAQTPIPQCNLGAPDASGSGALRLTGADLSRSGAVFDTQALSTGGGLDITFHQAQYGGTTAVQAPNGPRTGDGISFFIVNGTSNSTTAGATGQALGYANVGGTPGVANGLLGVGLDAFGNFSLAAGGAGGTDCPGGAGGGPGNVQNSVAIRGSGNGTSGYCWLAGSGPLNTTTFPMGDSSNGTGTRATRDILVRIVFDPANTTGATRNVTVYLNGTQVVQTPAPAALIAAPTFKFGFASSTGGASDVHEVWGLVVASVAPLPPTGPTATPGNQSIEVKWTPPTNPGSGPITGYEATATNGSTTKSCTAPGTATTCTITEVPPGTYTVTVTARNASGTSAPSEPVTVTVAVSAAPRFTG